MIWRIRERSAFVRLAREGQRARAGVLWCTFIPDPDAQPPRVAFALGRAIGTAVLRNRVRRQLRAQLSEAPLGPGWYLFGAKPTVGTRSADELMSDLHLLLTRLPCSSA